MKNTEGVPCGRGLEAPENIISKSDFFASYCKHSNSLISPVTRARKKGKMPLHKIRGT